MQKGTPTSDRIGAYRVIRELSVAGSVQIHLACEDVPGEVSPNVVLKVVPNAPDRGAKDTQKLIREGTACSRMTHPGIVRTRKVFKHKDAVVLVVEHVEGVSLAELLADGTQEGERLLSDDAALLIGSSICDALAHAHAMVDESNRRAPLVHRAVNPSNILVGRDGSVKLDGFGFANVFGGVAAGATDETTWTPAYMAPEQTADQPTTHKVDVYAAALILWELLTGRKSTILPHDPFAIEATLKVVAERKLEPLAKLRPDLPTALTGALDAALASNPDDRTIACAELSRCIRKMFQFARGKGELRDRVNAALARSPMPERRPIPPVEPPQEPNAPASAPRVPASAPRVQESAPRTAPSIPRLPESAPRVRESSPRAARSIPRLPESAPRVPPKAMQHTLVGIAPPRIEVPATSPLAPPRAPEASPATHSSPMWADDLASEAPAPRPAPSTLSGLGDGPGMVPVPVPTPAPSPPPSPPEIDWHSGPHPAQLAVTADTMRATPDTEESDQALRQDAAGDPQWQASSLGELLKAPTPWRRSPWLVAWGALLLSLGALVAKVSSSRAPAATVVSPRTTALAGSAAPSATPLVVVPSLPAPEATTKPRDGIAAAPKTAEGVAAPPKTAEGVAAKATEEVAALREDPPPDKASAPTEIDESLRKSLLKRGLGHLTVHSTASRASVFVNLKLFGGFDETLTVPCGKQFVSIGIPARRPAQPIWLAPGKSIIIPCGGAYEATMNPRPLR